MDIVCRKVIPTVNESNGLRPQKAEWKKTEEQSVFCDFRANRNRKDLKNSYFYMLPVCFTSKCLDHYKFIKAGSCLPLAPSCGKKPRAARQ